MLLALLWMQQHHQLLLLVQPDILQPERADALRAVRGRRQHQRLPTGRYQAQIALIRRREDSKQESMYALVDTVMTGSTAGAQAQHLPGDSSTSAWPAGSRQNIGGSII